MNVTTSIKSARAKKARADLVALLGGKCANCPRTENLHCDCIVPQGAAHHLLPWPERVRFYWKEHLRGNLQLMCPACHMQKTMIDNRKAGGLRKQHQIPHPVPTSRRLPHV